MQIGQFNIPDDKLPAAYQASVAVGKAAGHPFWAWREQFVKANGREPTRSETWDAAVKATQGVA